MALETGVTYIEDLVATNPAATDDVEEGQKHLNIIKTAIQGSFPNLGSAAVTKTAAEINDIPTTLLNQKVIDIGDWNMDTTLAVNVAHGLADFKKVRTINVLIRNDADTTYTDLSWLTPGFSDAKSYFISSTNVTISRSDGFNSTDYDSTSYNRGWITIQYTD